MASPSAVGTATTSAATTATTSDATALSAMTRIVEAELSEAEASGASKKSSSKRTAPTLDQLIGHLITHPDHTLNAWMRQRELDHTTLKAVRVLTSKRFQKGLTTNRQDMKMTA